MILRKSLDCKCDHRLSSRHGEILHLLFRNVDTLLFRLIFFLPSLYSDQWFCRPISHHPATKDKCARIPGHVRLPVIGFKL